MNIRDRIKKILREENLPIETEYLGWEVPSNLYDDLKSIGVKRWDEDDDRIYVAEIQFDTKKVVFEILDSEGEIYDNRVNDIPPSYHSYYSFKLDDLPRRLKSYIIRRVKGEWVNTMNKFK